MYYCIVYCKCYYENVIKNSIPKCFYMVSAPPLYKLKEGQKVLSQLTKCLFLHGFCLPPPLTKRGKENF